MVSSCHGSAQGEGIRSRYLGEQDAEHSCQKGEQGDSPLGAVISTGLGGPPVQLKPVLLSPVVKSSLPGKVGRQLHWFFGERFLPVGQIYLPFLGQIMGVIDVSEGGFMEGFPSITPIQPLKEEGRAETIPDEMVQVQQKEGFSAFLFPGGGPE